MTKTELMRELARAEVREKTDIVRKPSDIVPVIAKYANKTKEHFLSVTLNGHHEVIRRHVVSMGCLDRTIVHPREVFYDAIKDQAAAMIIAHNHPSGSTDPSIEDKDLTKRLTEAGRLLGIPVLDHVIISKEGYYSFLESGDM